MPQYRHKHDVYRINEIIELQRREKQFHNVIRKRNKNCCIFVAMVNSVVVLFVIFLTLRSGNFGASLSAEKFTISDAMLSAPPQLTLVDNIQQMAMSALNPTYVPFNYDVQTSVLSDIQNKIVHLSNPKNLSISANLTEKFDFSDSVGSFSSHGPDIESFRPVFPVTDDATENSDLRRKPALTFLEPSPTVISKPVDAGSSQFPKFPVTNQKYPGFIASIPHTTEGPVNTGSVLDFSDSLLLDNPSNQVFDDYSGDISGEGELFPDYYFPTGDSNDASGEGGTKTGMYKFSEKMGSFDQIPEPIGPPLLMGHRRRQKFRRVKGRRKSGTFATNPETGKGGNFAQLVTFKPEAQNSGGDIKKRVDLSNHNLNGVGLNLVPPPNTLKNRAGYGPPHFDHHFAASSGYGSDPHEDDHKPHKGGVVATRNPGPYGYPSPNFKCEYAKETLYVTKTDWTFDKKCFTVYRTKCRQEYEVGKGIGFKKECSEFSVERCRTEYDTDSETKCWTVFRKECFQVYVTKVEWEYEEKCETVYEEKCTGHGYDKHCKQVPKEHCTQIPIKVEKQVPRTKCKKVPEKKCQDFPIFIPRKACRDFPKTVCVKDPINVPKKIPKKVCASIPKEVCNKIPVQIIKHVPKTVTKKVCTSTKPSGYHPYSDDSSFHPPSSSNFHTTFAAKSGELNIASADGRDSNVYFDGVEEVPHFDYSAKK